MRRLLSWLLPFLKDEEGPTAVEYAVMLALIVIVCISAIATLGSNAHHTYDHTAEVLGEVNHDH